MKKIENGCVGCPTEMGCLGNSCKYRNIVVFYCDECGEETDTLYRYNGYELCQDCLLDKFDIVDDSTYDEFEEL